MRIPGEVDFLARKMTRLTEELNYCVSKLAELGVECGLQATSFQAIGKIHYAIYRPELKIIWKDED